MRGERQKNIERKREEGPKRLVDEGNKLMRGKTKIKNEENSKFFENLIKMDRNTFLKTNFLFHHSSEFTPKKVHNKLLKK